MQCANTNEMHAHLLSALEILYDLHYRAIQLGLYKVNRNKRRLIISILFTFLFQCNAKKLGDATKTIEMNLHGNMNIVVLKEKRVLWKISRAENVICLYEQ